VGVDPAAQKVGAMKSIKAIIQLARLGEVRDALIAVGVEGMTLSEVKGFKRQRGHTELDRAAEYEVNFVPKLAVEVVVDDGALDAAVDAITATARTGASGDGRIFVHGVEQAVRIRTGEMGLQALASDR